MQHGKGTRVLIGAYDFSGQGRSLELDVSTRDMATAISFADTAEKFVPGAIKSKIDHKGVFNDAVSGWSNWMHGRLGAMSGQPITVIPSEPVEGEMAFNMEIQASSVKVPISIGSVVAVEATYEGNRMMGQGLALAYEVAAAKGAYVGSGYQIAAVGKDDALQVAWHVIEENGAGTVTIKLQESVDNVSGNYTDISGATFAITGVDSKIGRFPGSRSAFIRTQVTVAGGTPTAKYVVSAAKVPKN